MVSDGRASLNSPTAVSSSLSQNVFGKARGVGPSSSETVTKAVSHVWQLMRKSFLDKLKESAGVVSDMGSEAHSLMATNDQMQVQKLHLVYHCNSI